MNQGLYDIRFNNLDYFLLNQPLVLNFFFFIISQKIVLNILNKKLLIS